MLKIRTNEEIENHDKCELYDNNDRLIGEINSLLILTDICCQIKEYGLKGYYIRYGTVKTEIESDGRIYFNQERPFTSMANMLRELI